MAQDKLKSKIAVGDYVAYHSTSRLRVGQVTKIGAKMLSIARIPADPRKPKPDHEYPSETVKVDEQAVLAYLLQLPPG